MTDKTLIMKDAQKYLSKGQIDKAISEWEKLVKVEPDGNTYNTIGDLYLKKGDKKFATESFSKAAEFFRREGFSLKSLALYKKVLNIDPSESNALYALGELSEEKGLTTDAVKYYLATADSMAKEGKKDKILDIYEKILSLSPSNIPLRNRVAEIFMKEGLKTDASKEYVYIAKLYEEKGDIQQSREYYQKVLEVEPSHKEAIIGMSYLYEKTGELDSAVEHMQEASGLFPDDVDVLLRCAELSLIKEDTDRATDYLYRIIEKEPANIKARRLLGEIYLKNGLKEKAWVEYLPVLDGMILEEKYENAINLLESFKEIDPLETSKRLISLYRQLGENDQLATELISLGDLFNERDMNDDALFYYREALEIVPDDNYLKEKVAEIVKTPEIEEEAVVEQISIKGAKTVEEIFTEADIFSRYGLLGEAKRLLEELKLREPENIDLHMRLKSVYMDASDKELAVTECLILNELFKRLGDVENAEDILKDAYRIYPEDPRLTERAGMSLFEATSHAAPEKDEFGDIAATGRDIEDYRDEIAEADFYARQGLIQESVKILEKLHGLFPDNTDINERLTNLGQVSEVSETAEITNLGQVSEVSETAEITNLGQVSEASETAEITNLGQVSEVSETAEISEVIEPPVAGVEDAAVTETAPLEKEDITEGIEQQPEKSEYEDFTLTDQDLVEADEMSGPKLDSDVQEIFQEFKKGLEKELGDEDSETHYNLGIAYKEMGLIDDAIKGFQTSKNDPKRFLQSSTMLGVCYMEKGLYPLAIEVLNDAIKNVDNKEDTYWAIKYDLAEAHEKNNNFREALDLYTAVYGWDAKFRNVSEKISQVRVQLVRGAERGKIKERKDRVSYL